MINSEYKNRRASVISQIKDDSLLILFSASEKYRNNDVAYKYRQSSNFYYLTGINDPSTILMITKNGSNINTTLICKRPNDLDKVWHGQVPSKHTYKKKYDIEHVIYSDEVNKLSVRNVSNLYYEFSDEYRFTDLLQEINFDTEGSRYFKHNNSQSSKNDLYSLVCNMRRVKSDFEINEIREAANVSIVAHTNLMKNCKPGINENDLEAEFVKICKSKGCEQAYPAIVASGKNACILHYTQNNSKLRSNQLILVDAAAEYNNYASDITRTIPISGRYNYYQKIIYNIVLKSQMMAIKACKPGNTLIDIHNVAVKYITKGLIDVKILRGTLDKNIKKGLYKKYFMHNTGHWLGLDVHDPSSYSQDEKPITLEPGMIFTVEPGIYIDNDKGIDKGFHHIGVRIEDDILITKKGCEVLTKGVPKTIEAIENLMSHG